MPTFNIKCLFCGESMNTDFSGAQCSGKNNVLIKLRDHRAELYLELFMVHA